MEPRRSISGGPRAVGALVFPKPCHWLMASLSSQTGPLTPAQLCILNLKNRRTGGGIVVQLKCVLVCLPGLEPVLRVSQGLRFQAIHSALACFRLACTLLTAGSDKPHSSCLRALGAGRWDGPVHKAGKQCRGGLSFPEHAQGHSAGFPNLSFPAFSLEGSGISFADLFRLIAFYCISR